jgi:SAM-dependent methyltransferase
MNTPHHGLWDRDYKIPWHDPAFSRRMLAEHLAQNHDLASRRFEWIDRQVEWIHRMLLAGRPADILDLGCGPGFYSHRLAARGHRCRGIDFGPASIEYAIEHNRHGCDFVLGDIRHTAYGGPYDMAMILFGEMNLFSPAEVQGILCRAHASLASRQGTLILEVQAPEAVERAGRSEPVEEQFESGLFSDRPYRCRTESQWLPEPRVAVRTFTVATTEESQTYRNTTKAWSADELASLLEAAGFSAPCPRPDWPCNTGDLALWSALS